MVTDAGSNVVASSWLVSWIDDLVTRMAARVEAAVGRRHPQWGERAAVEGVRRVGRVRALGRRHVRPEGDRHGGVGGERRDRPEGHPLAGEEGRRRPLRGLVGGHLVGGGDAQRDRLVAGAQRGDREHRVGIDALVEGGDEHRLQVELVAARHERLHGRRRCVEGDDDRLGEHATGGRGGAGRDRDGVVRRPGQAARRRSAVAVGGVEAQRARADPLPAPGRRPARGSPGRRRRRAGRPSRPAPSAGRR